MMGTIPRFFSFYCLPLCKGAGLSSMGKAPFFFFTSFFFFIGSVQKLASLQSSCAQTSDLHLLLGDIASACLSFTVNAQT